MADRASGNRQRRGLFSGWRGLGRFWSLIAVLLLFGAGGLELLGPPPYPPTHRQSPLGLKAAKQAPAQRPAPATKPAASAPLVAAVRQPIVANRPGRTTPGPIADPNPLLQEPDPADPNRFLPRIGPDGETPMTAYAAGFDTSSLRPRVGILITGLGMNQDESLRAIKTLPGGISLAFSPYAGNITRLLAAARIHQHEYLLSIPMEPRTYPLNDPDDRHALMTSLSPTENMRRLHEILGQLAGYVGVTDAFGPIHGGRLAAMPTQFDPVLREIARRGLLFVDAQAGERLLPYAWNRAADVILDASPLDAATLDQRLADLTALARAKGSALGIVSVPRPLAIARIAAWANTLQSQGLALAPVSALVLPPAKQDPHP